MPPYKWYNKWFLLSIKTYIQIFIKKNSSDRSSTMTFIDYENNVIQSVNKYP